MFTKEDIIQIEEKGITEKDILLQLESFAKGFPFLKLHGSATSEKGITKLNVAEEDLFLNTWNDYLNSGGEVLKFVPASGAASRMFKNLFEFLSADYDLPQTSFEKKFFERIKDFAFYDELDSKCKELKGENIDELIRKGEFKTIVDLLLNNEGLNYGSLPKGMLTFHAYDDENRKAVTEHLVEGALYAKNNDGKVKVHFTVSPEHKDFFENEIIKVSDYIENKYKVKLIISFSVQKPSTDTIAADSNNMPFRENGKLVFRPGGHGALIENLNDLDADVVFIKNIDNIVPDRLKDTTVKYKKILAGLLVSLQKKAFSYLELIDKGNYTHENLVEIIKFVQNDLNTRNPETKFLEDSELALYLKSKLNRPIRVCGMVRNEGEPGGGPFWAYNQDGTYSLQILESSQIDLSDPDKKAMFEKGTHFNPVDLVCSVKDYKGNRFDLTKFIDKQTGFISVKSKNGSELKALELPGLWNGAMSDWNTIFVEVPMITFNPVKTVNDLLRSEHQPV